METSVSTNAVEFPFSTWLLERWGGGKMEKASVFFAGQFGSQRELGSVFSQQSPCWEPLSSSARLSPGSVGAGMGDGAGDSTSPGRFLGNISVILYK